MENLIKLFCTWEIQLLVLLSFAIQIFLFFAGGLRRRRTNMIIRLSIWIAYLGADMVAVYALGYISRNEDTTTRTDTIIRGNHPLAFLWASFLIVHLGGQDTITAFAIEDNKLWLRHLLNLVVQIVLALYVFLNSIGSHSTELLVSSMSILVAGVIKYGERTWSLKCGSLDSLESSTESHPRSWLPEMIGRRYAGYYVNTVLCGLKLMPNVHVIFAAHALSDSRGIHGRKGNVINVLGIHLGIMYDDLYTKAFVLRTRTGIILRCISQIFVLVAFILFLQGDKQHYSRSNIAITFLLFAGVFFLEVCALFIFLMSPWTWAWLKSRGYDRLAQISWYLFSIRWPEKRPLWSNTMGQYNFFGWLVCNDQRQQKSTIYQQSMMLATKLAALAGVEKKKIFWMSKLLDKEYVKADRMLECLIEVAGRIKHPREWQNLGPSLIFARSLCTVDFGFTIVMMHSLTELHLRKYHRYDGTNVLVKDCRKLSRYMMYLLVTHPSLLPLDLSEADTLKHWHSQSEDEIMKELEGLDPQPSKETLLEIKEMWIRLIIYAATKSRPEMHAALLARGGELLTFIWLLLSHNGFRLSSFDSKIELTKERPGLVLYLLDS